jgi:hypothetical protein
MKNGLIAAGAPVKVRDRSRPIPEHAGVIRIPTASAKLAEIIAAIRIVPGGLAVFPQKLFAALSGRAEIVKGRSDETEGGGPRFHWHALTRGPLSAPCLPACLATARSRLNKRGYLRWDERCRGEAINTAVNRLIARQR